VRRHAFHPEASQEYSEAARYYARVDHELAGRFFDEIEKLILDVCHHPERFRIFDPPVRRHLSDVFPYSVVFLAQPELVWIVAVMHFKREPSYWKQRMVSPPPSP